MELSTINIPGKKAEILFKNNIVSVESLLYKEPKTYWYFDKVYSLELSDELRGLMDSKTPIAIIGCCESVESQYKHGRSLIKIKVVEEITQKTLHINILGEFKKLSLYISMKEHRVIVGGKLQYSPEYHSFSMLNPVLISCMVEKYNRIIPVYSKYKGISEEYYRKIIQDAVREKGDLDYIPMDILQQYKLGSFKDAAMGFHYPKSREDILAAKKRKIFDDMLYFTCKLEEQAKGNTSSFFQIKTDDKMEWMIDKLPYRLTDGQQYAINEMVAAAKEGRRISSLIQGDVGSGKTIVALAMMICMAENGYQSVLMAPTAVLAKQHFLELEKFSKDFGFKAVFLSNELKASEKKKALVGIKSGEILFVVGTHSCIGKSVEYHNLALTITDEEHKFGVLQRQALIEKSKEGVHNIIMSATPIPRTLANTLYGNNTEVYSLKLPANRKPIQTAICVSNKPVFNWMEKEINKGRQAYVVCPLIDKAEENSKMEGVASLEEMQTLYKDYFEPRGIKVAVVTGKTSKEEQGKILQEFKENQVQILMATTVIEVGINNPNATVITITGAERFGLATLHQLRGRVGRGEYQSYCILQKSNANVSGSNLEILCHQTDGLEIAKEDLKNRGTGNLFGKEQSGQNKYIELLLEYPNMYNKVKRIAHKLCKNHTGKDMIEIYETFFTTESHS